LRTEEYFTDRAASGDVKKAFQVLKRAGKGNPRWLAMNYRGGAGGEDESARGDRCH